MKTNWDAIVARPKPRPPAQFFPNRTLSRFASVRRSMQGEAMLGRQPWPSEEDVAEAIFEQFKREIV